MWFCSMPCSPQLRAMRSLPPLLGVMPPLHDLSYMQLPARTQAPPARMSLDLSSHDGNSPADEGSEADRHPPCEGDKDKGGEADGGGEGAQGDKDKGGEASDGLDLDEAVSDMDSGAVAGDDDDGSISDAGELDHGAGFALSAVDGLAPMSRRGENLRIFNEEKHVPKATVADRLGLRGQARKLFMRREERREQRDGRVMARLSETKTTLDSVSVAWNKGRLRRGDRLDPDTQRRVGSGTGKRVDPKAWTIAGTLELAFGRIGALAPRASTLRETKRPLDAVVVVSLAASEHQRGATQAWVQSLMSQSASASSSSSAWTPRWAFIGRCHDCTPLKVGFGSLRSLAAVARYWYREAGGAPARLLTASEYRERKGALPSFGIVELMAQDGEVCWPEGIAAHAGAEDDADSFIAVNRHRLRFAPSYLARTNASTIFAAVEGVDASLSIASIIELTAAIEFVCLFIGSDLASSCARSKQEVARRILAHNEIAESIGHGVVLLFDGHCASHVLHREIESCFGTKTLIPKLHAVAYSTSLPANHAKIMRALWTVVTSDLENHFFPGVEPPVEAWAHHTKTIAEVTLLRCKYARAQVEDGDYVSEEQAAVYFDFLRLLNGDPRLPYVQHYCHTPGCCEGRSIAVAALDIYDILAACFFMDMGVCLPSAIKWYTFSPHLARQCGALFFHKLLPRVLAEAWSAPDEEEEEEGEGREDVDSFRAAAAKKRATATEFVENPATAPLLGFALVACLPIDHLSYRLQHLDHQGGSMAELIDSGPRSILIKCQQNLWELLNSWHAPGEGACDLLESVMWFLRAFGVEENVLLDDSRARCVGLCAAVWSRLELKYSPLQKMLFSRGGD